MTLAMTYHSALIPGLIILLQINSVGSSCDEKQKLKCKDAGASGSIPSLSEGGTCQGIEDPPFTSACTVSHYVVGVDFCCCAHQGNSQCCRYHYNHADFFCEEATDVVGKASSLPPVWVLCVSVIVPVVVVALCIYCGVKCYQDRHRLMGNDENTRHKRNNEVILPRERNEASAVLLHESESNSSVTNTPEPSTSNRTPVVVVVDSESPPPKAPPLPATADASTNGAHRLPSAPPISEEDDEDEDEARDSISDDIRCPRGMRHPSGVRRNQSEPGDTSPPRFHGANHEMFRRYSESESAPPTYEESKSHPPAYEENPSYPSAFY